MYGSETGRSSQNKMAVYRLSMNGMYTSITGESHTHTDDSHDHNIIFKKCGFWQAQNFLIEKTLIKEKKIHKQHSYLYIICHKTHKQSFKLSVDFFQSDEVVKITSGPEHKISLVAFQYHLSAKKTKNKTDWPYSHFQMQQPYQTDVLHLYTCKMCSSVSVAEMFACLLILTFFDYLNFTIHLWPPIRVVLAEMKFFPLTYFKFSMIIKRLMNASI